MIPAFDPATGALPPGELRRGPEFRRHRLRNRLLQIRPRFPSPGLTTFVFCRSSILRKKATMKIRRYEADGLSASLIAKSRLSRPEVSNVRLPSDSRLSATSPEAEIKDPFALEFLGLKDEYSEVEPEESLIRELEQSSGVGETTLLS